MSKAVNVGNKNNLTRTVKNYADSVVQQASQAVAEGAKLLQDYTVISPLSYFVSLQPTLHIIKCFCVNVLRLYNTIRCQLVVFQWVYENKHSIVHCLVPF